LDTLNHLLEVKNPNYTGLAKKSKRQEKDKKTLNKMNRDDKKGKTKNKVN